MKAKILRVIPVATFTVLCAFLFPEYASPQDQSQDNIIVVLDASGSMKTLMKGGTLTRMDAAKQALLKIVENLPPNANVGLLVFSSRNLRDDWAYPLGSVDKKKLVQAINLPDPEGSTPLGKYLKKGTDKLLEQRQAQHNYGTFRLLVVTDGEASDPEVMNSYLPDILSRGITMDVIGVDMRQDHVLAAHAHSYRRANDPESLKRAVSEVFAEVGSSKDDQMQADMFAILQPIPDEMAEAMLKALAPAGNQPISANRPGKEIASQNPVAPANPTAPSTGAPPPRTNPPQPAAPPPRPQSSQPAPKPKTTGRSNWTWLIVIFVLLAVRGIRQAAGKRR